jgi:S-formylglutathione hydrolase FrmB
MKKKLFFLFLALHGLKCTAAVVDTIQVYSSCMKKKIPCVLIRPDSYKTTHRLYPVVYLLHGYSGNYKNWIVTVPSLKKQVDDLQLLIVCPDGAYSSWYFDSPVDSAMRYETFVSNEVPSYIDRHYRTIKNKHARAITGLSMGGHGGLFIGIRHSAFFGACGSMSGVVDLFASQHQFEIIQRIGDTTNHNPYWYDYSVINVIEKYNRKDSLAIMFDCGIDDFTYQPNHKLHEKMLQLKIPHDYIERPGDHNWAYWGNAIQYQLLFFKNYFGKYYK